MCVRDPLVDAGLVVREEGVNVLLVEQTRSLALRQHEVAEKDQADEGVERDPGEDGVGVGFEEGEEAEGDPVHEPGGEEGGVGGAEGFVGGEDGEEDGD